jgi:hypothetical protein
MSVFGKLVSTCGLWGVIVTGAVSMVQGQEASQTAAAPATQPVATQPIATQPTVATGPESEAAIVPADSQSMVKSGMPRKPAVGRLPRYFASLVDSRQRAAIYQIQSTMATKIEALERQLEELRQAEMREMEAVLNDTQLQQLQSLRASRMIGAPATGT